MGGRRANGERDPAARSSTTRAMPRSAASWRSRPSDRGHDRHRRALAPSIQAGSSHRPRGPRRDIGWVVAVLVSLLIGWVVALGIAVLVGPFAAVGLGRLLELAPRLEPLAEPAFAMTAAVAPAVIAAVSLWLLASVNAPR